MRQGLITIFYVILIAQNFTFPSGKLRTEFTSRKEESTGPGLLDTTLFAYLP